ncbi:uncharacterized protein V6R79_002433 [Siganus canaliculatus]
MSLLRTVLNNSLIIHPPGFYIIGFETLPFINVYFIFLAFVYVITVLFNCIVISVILFTRRLHTPKFLAVVNLAVIDIILNTCTIPSMIKLFLIKDNFIPFNLCLLQMFVYYCFASLESYALAILAYDRLIAICFPLRHNSVNTLRSMSGVVGLTWILAIAVIVYTITIMTHLSFCSSVRVYSYFCDYTPVFRLACNDTTLHWSSAFGLTILLLVGPFTFILLSYISILVTVFRMKSVENRLKALATCVEHIILVAVFYIPLLTIFTIGFYLGTIDPDHRVLSLSLASCIPPCINPIVYSLKTKEIKIRILTLRHLKQRLSSNTQWQWKLTMSAIRTALNESLIIHPPGFYIIGFETFPYISVYYIFLAVVYVITVLFNSLVIFVISFNYTLHTPKFLAVVNLAVIDIIHNSVTIPNMINLFLAKNNFVPFNLCLVQMCFYYTFVCLESYALAILAYDRFIAICFPLRHNSINTLRSMSCGVGITWSYAVGLIAYTVCVMTRLSFCKSVRVFSFFCDYAPVFRLACNDNTLQWFLASTFSVVNLMGPFSFIILSYVSILVTVLRMKSIESRRKALATCVEHLILVAVFYIPIFTIYVFGLYLRLIDPDQRVLSLSLASCIPPCVNPIVYSLKTKEIKIRVLTMMRKINYDTDKRKIFPNS